MHCFCRALELVRWFDTRKQRPTAAQVIARFECHRATAYRYLQLWDDHYGSILVHSPPASRSDFTQEAK